MHESNALQRMQQIETNATNESYKKRDRIIK